jgi:hypothetical protein
MNAKEFYDHILKHMTAEQALMKMLERTVVEYNILKFSEEGEEIHPEILIAMACFDRGWDIAILDPKSESDDEFQGMILGTREYIDDILDHMDYAKEIKIIKNDIHCNKDEK